MQSSKAQLPIEQNDSTGFDKAKMVTKANGSQEPFNAEELRAHLSKYTNELNNDYLNLDIIIGKVNAGLPNGKCRPF